jgi:hypothetical protein
MSNVCSGAHLPSESSSSIWWQTLVFLPLSTLGRRVAGGPCREDDLDDVIVDYIWYSTCCEMICSYKLYYLFT